MTPVPAVALLKACKNVLDSRAVRELGYYESSQHSVGTGAVGIAEGPAYQRAKGMGEDV